MFRDALRADPSDARAVLGLARTLADRGDIDQARALLETSCTALGGQNSYLWTHWGILESSGGRRDFARARRLFDAATAADPRNAAAWHAWGCLEMRQGDLQRAMDLFTKGLKYVNSPEGTSSPSHATYLYCSLGQLCEKMGSTEEASRWYAEGVKTPHGRRSNALWNSWALLEVKKDTDPDTIRKLFTRALEANPKARHTYLAWGRFEAAAGDKERARGLFRKGTLNSPRDAALLQAWGVLEGKSGDAKAAPELFQRCLGVTNGRNLHAWQAWAMLEWRLGEIARARELFEKGIAKTNPSKAWSYIFQPWALMELQEGNVGLARELLKVRGTLVSYTFCF
jgi:tetratricopeptide (TPR) repeat protein